MRRRDAAICARCLRRCKMLTALCAAIVLGAGFGAGDMAALAQGIGTSFEGYKKSADKPIDIEADILEVDDKKKLAVFRGNVVARQGGFSLKAKELQVHYTGDAGSNLTPTSADDPGKPDAAASKQKGARGSRITRIEAKGKVLVTTKEGQSATSEWARFHVVKQVVTIGGSVVLSQGENVLRGDRLVIDLKSGKSRFEVAGESGKQRIRGLFQPKRN